MLLPHGPLTFHIVHEPPGRDAPTLQKRKNGMVIARYDETEAGVLYYGLGPGQALRLTNVEVVRLFRRRTCATQMLEAVSDHFPTLPILDGGNSNTEVGTAVLQRWRQHGLVGEGLGDPR